MPVILSGLMVKVLIAILISGATFSAPMVIDSAIGDSVGPGHPLYAVERLGETQKSWFILDHASKATYYIQLATERLDEMKNVTDNGEIVKSLCQDYNSTVEKALDEAEKANRTDVYDFVLSMLQKHQQVLTEVKDKVPEQAKGAIDNAMRESSKSRDVIENLKKSAP